MNDPLVTEFRPIVVARRTRIVLGAVLTALLLPLTGWAVALVWLPATVAYRVSADALTVVLDRGVWRRERVFPLSTLGTVTPVTLQGGSRRVGTALPGYCVGTFSYPDLGSVWQATSCSRSGVLLTFAAHRVLVSPPDQADFIAAVATRRPGIFPAAPHRPAGPGWTAFRLLLGAPALLVLIVPAVFFLAPGRLRYLVEPGELVVVTLLGRRRFTLSGATARRHEPAVDLKLVGSALPGYWSGLFQVDGKRTRVYATSRTAGVLIEGERRVFVTPSETDRFLAAVVAAGASIAPAPPKGN